MNKDIQHTQAHGKNQADNKDMVLGDLEVYVSDEKPFIDESENQLALIIAKNEEEMREEDLLDDSENTTHESPAFLTIQQITENKANIVENPYAPTENSFETYKKDEVPTEYIFGEQATNDQAFDAIPQEIEESVKNIVKIVNNSDGLLDEYKEKKRKKKKKKKKKKALRERLVAETAANAQDDNVSYLAPEHDPCDPAYMDSEFFHPADRAEQLESLSLEKQLCMLTHMDTEEAAEAIAELDDISARDLIENLDAQDAAKILSAMDRDDAVDVLDDVEEGHRDVLLNSLAPEEAMELRALLTFDPDTAAGVMNTEIIIISDDESVDDAIHHIRLGLEDKDMPYYVYVVNELERLVGIISLRELMLSKPGTLVQDLISNKRELITAQFDLDKTEVAKLISHYNFLALPVVDRMGHLMGTVTHDDVIDIIQENASSDLLGMVGAGQDEDINTPWKESVRMRLPWLFINMLNSSISAYIVYLFEGSIAQMAFLAVLMPMIANQAGNTGQQALAVMIRQLATEKFDSKKSWRAVFREGKIGFTTGIIMALCALFIVWFITKNPMLGGIMGASLLLDMLLGSIAGGSIPLVLRALGRDPAQASSIFLTALTDGAGFFIFLSFASVFVL